MGAETLKSLEIQVLVARLGLLPPGAKSRSKSQLADLLTPQLVDPANSEVCHLSNPISSQGAKPTRANFLWMEDQPHRNVGDTQMTV